MTKTKIIVMVASVFYVLSPIDLIPDIIPVIGWVDDVLVGAIGVATALSAVTQTLKTGKPQ